MSQKSSFTVVIPCYNEAESVRNFLIELSDFEKAFTKSYPNTSLSIKIVDNNSTDNSLYLLQQGTLGTATQILKCRSQGYGAALKFGFESSDSDYYAFADLDNTYPLKDLIVMFKLIQVKDAEMVLGARVHDQSEIEPIRRLGNLIYRRLTNLLFSSEISDSCSGMRIFSNRVKSQILALNRSDLSFSIEMTAKALKHGWAILEYPIGYRDRLGKSKLSVPIDGFKFFFVLMRVRFFG